MNCNIPNSGSSRQKNISNLVLFLLGFKNLAFDDQKLVENKILVGGRDRLTLDF